MRPTTIRRTRPRGRPPRCPRRSGRGQPPGCTGLPRRARPGHLRGGGTARRRPCGGASRAPGRTWPASRLCRRPAVRRWARRSRTLSSTSKLLRFAGTHVLRQLVMEVNRAAFHVGIGLGALKSERLHALLYGGHIREILREDGAPVGVVGFQVHPFGLRLLAFGVKLITSRFEDAAVGVVAVGPRAVAQRRRQALPDLKVRKDLPGGTALGQMLGFD